MKPNTIEMAINVQGDSWYFAFWPHEERMDIFGPGVVGVASDQVYGSTFEHCLLKACRKYGLQRLC